MAEVKYCMDCGKQLCKLAQYKGTKRCHGCANQLKRTDRVLCVDCGKPLSRSAKCNGYTRCAPCSKIARRLPTIYCLDCGTPLHHRAGSKGSVRCTSCFSKFKRGPQPTCVDCGARLGVNAKYIGTIRCQRCNGITRHGAGGSAWKGGVSAARQITHASAEYKLWRRTVFGLDNYTCSICGKHSGVLHVHHILPYSEFPDYRMDVNNGATLCAPCHKQFHLEQRAEA